MPCVVSPYGTSGTGYWCPGYNWGTIPNNTGNVSELSPYGYDYRNCTDYVAWELSTLGVKPAQYRGLGNADTWGSNATSHGLVDNTTPAVGSVAVSTSGEYGHVAFVTAVNGGTITVSQYNQKENGDYSVQSGTPTALGFSSFVHFEAYETNGSLGGGSSAQMILDGDGDGQVWAKSTIGYGAWTQETPAGEKAISAGNGVQMILDGDGQVWAKSTIGYGAWTQETPAGEKAISAGNGVQMILDGDGQVWAKSTIGYGAWTQETPAGEDVISAG
jgi:surface antigen